MTQPALKEVATIERSAIQEFEITPAKVEAMAKEYMTLTVPEGDTKAYRDAREKQEAEEQAKYEAAEAARKEALKPDREKLMAWADELLEIKCPVCADPFAQSIGDEIMENVRNIATFLKVEIKEKL